MDRGTDGWWVIRIELAIGVGAAVLWSLTVARSLQPTFEPRIEVLGLPEGVWTLATSGVAIIVGLVWMIRIFRGPRDEPPAWRYRDR